MKVVFVIPSLTSGGAERVVTRLSNYWVEKGFDMTILSMDNSSDKPFYLLNKKVKYEALNILKSRGSWLQRISINMKRIYILREKIKELRPQIVISFLPLTNFVTLTATLFLKLKVIVSERSNPRLSSVNPLLSKVNSILYLSSDYIVVQTEAVKACFSKVLYPKLKVIPNPVPEPNISAQSIKKTKTIITVGRLEKMKGQDYLIKAFSKIHKKFPEWNLLIVGDGPERERLEKLCTSLKINDVVKLPGRCKKIDNILFSSEIFVLSSRYEGFPNALCEAMACGLAVISTNCNYGPSEIILNDTNGVLVPIDNVGALSDAIEDLISNKDKREQCGKRAKEIVNSYSLIEISKKWESLF